MQLTSILAIYVLFWTFALFLVLPFGVRTADEAGAPKIAGQADSAPHGFSGRRTVLWTTIVATVLFAAYYLNYVNGWISAQSLDLFSPGN